jgi:hypothetical protein
MTKKSRKVPASKTVSLRTYHQSVLTISASQMIDCYSAAVSYHQSYDGLLARHELVVANIRKCLQSRKMPADHMTNEGLQYEKAFGLVVSMGKDYDSHSRRVRLRISDFLENVQRAKNDLGDEVQDLLVQLDILACARGGGYQVAWSGILKHMGSASSALRDTREFGKLVASWIYQARVNPEYRG